MIYTSPEDTKALEKRSLASHQSNTEPSKTVQGPAQEADTNYIAKAYGLTGKHMPVPPEIFDPRHYREDGDIPVDLHSAMNLVLDAQRQFDALPADLRAKFNHSPGILWDWLQNPANGPEAVQLGLLVDPTPKAPPSPPEPKPDPK